MPDGDNPTSIQIHKESLMARIYSRNDFPEIADIITVVQYIEKISFSKAMYRICEICGYEYYSNYNKEETDPCVAFLDYVEPKNSDEDEVPLRVIDENILSHYEQFPNIWFLNEGISIETQLLFEIGYSLRDSCITIPIRDELGSLVGIKGRTILDYDKLKIPKYWFPIPAPKNQILYGLDKNYDHIMSAGKVYVFEAEKSVMKAHSYGIYNAVSIGGDKLSETQILKLERLNVDVILALDKNVTSDDIKKEAKKFIIQGRLFTIYENKIKEKKLKEKDSPIDQGLDYFNELCKVDIYKVRTS